jgi:hypothetical protein
MGDWNYSRMVTCLSLNFLGHWILETLGRSSLTGASNVYQIEILGTCKLVRAWNTKQIEAVMGWRWVGAWNSLSQCKSCGLGTDTRCQLLRDDSQWVLESLGRWPLSGEAISWEYPWVLKILFISQDIQSPEGFKHPLGFILWEFHSPTSFHPVRVLISYAPTHSHCYIPKLQIQTPRCLKNLSPFEIVVFWTSLFPHLSTN